MALKITKMLAPQSKYKYKCPFLMDPEYITVHNTYSDASAMAEISYMIGNNNYVSYHYAVDDIQAVQGVKLNRNTYNAGDGSGKGNMKSIAVEICYSKSGGERFVKAEKNAAKLIAILLHERGWGMDRVKRHKDWSGKYCPHRTLDKGWTRFTKLVSAELEELKRPKMVNVKDVKDFKVKVIAKTLKVREGYGSKYDKIGTLKKGTVCTIVKTNADGTWGLLKAGPVPGHSWINLSSAYVSGDVADFKVKIICDVLNVRKGPGAKYTKLGTYKKGTKLTIIKTNSDGTWGLLKAGPKVGSSWVNLSKNYVKRV